jgi:hypothetical protein
MPAITGLSDISLPEEAISARFTLDIISIFTTIMIRGL